MYVSTLILTLKTRMHPVLAKEPKEVQEFIYLGKTLVEWDELAQNCNRVNWMEYQANLTFGIAFAKTLIEFNNNGKA
jgi:hypothetical protein